MKIAAADLSVVQPGGSSCANARRVTPIVIAANAAARIATRDARGQHPVTPNRRFFSMKHFALIS